MGNIITNAFRSIFQKKTKLVMVGLEGSGKTTILFKLQYGEEFQPTATHCKLKEDVIQIISTIGQNHETIEYNNVRFSICDVASRLPHRWTRNLFENKEHLLYVVDSSDKESIVEAKYELETLLEDNNLKNCTLLVFANKQDLSCAMNAEEVAERLNLHSLKNRNWNIQATSAFTGQGLYEGLNWLSKQPNNTKGLD